MAYETIDHEPIRRRVPRRPRRSALEITLIAGFLFSLVIGLLALALLFWVRTPPQTTLESSVRPAYALQPSRISSPLALMQLAGDPADALAQQALAAGQLDTAFAIAVYGVEISPQVRQSLLLRVGRAFAQAGRNPEAHIALSASRSLAILSPQLTITERHQALLTAAETFLAINAAESAQDTLEQVLRSAAQTPGLLPAPRAEIFSAIRPLAQQAQANLLAAQAAEFARNPFLDPRGTLLVPHLVTYTGPAPDSPAIEEATAQRRFAARLLAERIQLTGGIDIEPEQQALMAALLAEDGARGDAFRTAQATADLTHGERLGFQQQWRNWLALKARIANGGFGLTLVPEWEANATFLLQDISGINTQINVTVDALSNDIADPVIRNHVRLEMLLRLARDWELGLHPDGAAADLHERLRIVQDDLGRLEHVPALPIEYSDTAIPPGFRIAGD